MVITFPLMCVSLVLRSILDVVMHYLPLKKLLLNILFRKVANYIVPLLMRQTHLTRFYIM